MEIGKFFALICSQLLIILLPYFASIVLLIFMSLYLLLYFDASLYNNLKRAIYFYTLAIILWTPFVAIEMYYFSYPLANIYSIIQLCFKSFTSLAMFLLYKRHTSLLELMSVLYCLRLPGIFLLATLFILYFLQRLYRNVFNMKAIFSLRVSDKRRIFRIKVIYAMIKNLIVFSAQKLEDIHSVILLRRLDRQQRFDLLYKYEKNYNTQHSD